MNYSTVPKSWKGWVDLGSDMNWEDYHGLWGKKAPDGSWFLLVFTNMEDACGDDALHGPEPMRYLCEVRQVCPKELSTKQQSDILSCIGMDVDDLREMSREQAEMTMVEGASTYGIYAPLCSDHSMARPTWLRSRMRKEAEAYMREPDLLEAALDMPVNQIGSTARDFRAGDIDAGLRRYASDVQATGRAPDERKNLMLKLHGCNVEELQAGPRIKRIRQSDLTGECWLVQMWGTSYCESCESKGTPDCGGQRILETGKNEKGIPIGEDGLLPASERDY
jgi:hypothetical protein